MDSLRPIFDEYVIERTHELVAGADRYADVARVERAVRHSPGLRCFLNVRVAPWAGLAGDDSATNRRRPLRMWCPMHTFCKPELLDVRQRVRLEISHGRRPLKRRVVSVVPRPNAAITI